MSGFKITGPGQGKGFSKDDHEDHLICFVGVSLEEGVRTSFGDSDAARCETIFCLDCLLVVTDQLVFGNALVPRLTSADDAEVVLGRLVKGEAKPNQKPPWLLEDPTEHDEARAEESLEKYATKLKSGRIVIEVPDKDDEGDEKF